MTGNKELFTKLDKLVRNATKYGDNRKVTYGGI